MTQPASPEDVAATFCATLVDEWVRAGLTDAVVAPGSRSTPMVLALADHPGIALHVFVDERSAAFFALGMARRTGEPALVLTTSGTAAVELHPAVVEAHHGGIPLLAVTADRPPEMHDVGAPQTIEQRDLYGRTTRWRADPGVPDLASAATWRSLASRAMCEARGGGGRPGPVHLNLAFREPLIGRPGPLPPCRDSGHAWHRAVSAPRALPAGMDELAEHLSGRAGVIVAGAGAGDPTSLHGLAGRLGWPVLAGGCSSARRPGPATVAAFDAILRHRPFAERARPQFVLRVGAAPASRILADWLAAAGAEEVLVESHGTWFDPEHAANVVVGAEPSAVCAALADQDLKPAPDSWARLWADAERAAQETIEETLGRYPEPTEPGVARTLVSCLPAGAGLVVASSMPIRDVEWYSSPRADLQVMANRGANGIDGTLGTVLGAAAASGGRPTAGLLGDLAFLHDAGSLLGAARRRLDAVLVVVDNRGGGIFSFLPQASSLSDALFEEFFATAHDLDVGALARVHGLQASEITSAQELEPAVTSGLEAGGITMIVVRTDRKSNVAVHESVHAAVADALERVID